MIINDTFLWDIVKQNIREMPRETLIKMYDLIAGEILMRDEEALENLNLKK